MDMYTHVYMSLCVCDWRTFIMRCFRSSIDGDATALAAFGACTEQKCFMLVGMYACNAFAERGLSGCVLLNGVIEMMKNKEILDPYWIDVFQRICLPRSVNATLPSHICLRS